MSALAKARIAAPPVNAAPSITIPVELAVEALEFIREYAGMVPYGLPGNPDGDMQPNQAMRLRDALLDAIGGKDA